MSKKSLPRSKVTAKSEPEQPELLPFHPAFRNRMINMTLSNAERQERWREKRKLVVNQAKHLHNAPLDRFVKDREDRGQITVQERRLTVQQLLKKVDPEEDTKLLAWLRSWLSERS